MNRTRSISGRILFIVAGVLVTVVAALLVVRGLRSLRSAAAGPAAAGEEAVASTATRPGGDRRTEDAAQWGWFSGAARSTAEPAAPARDLQRLPGVAGSPFDSAYARREVNRLGLRLEGVGRAGEAMALISGRVLRIGDRVADYQLVAIGRSGVTLVGAGGIRLDLTLQDRPAAPLGTPAAGGASVAGRAPAGSGAPVTAWAPPTSGASAAAGASGGRAPSQLKVGDDGLRERFYLPDGRLDLPATHPMHDVLQRENERGLPYDRFAPWPKGPFPQPPSAYMEREIRRQKEKPGS